MTAPSRRLLPLNSPMALLLPAFLLASAPALARVCPMVADPLWQKGHADATAGLNANVTALGAALAAQRALTLQMLVSATKVHTAQLSVNGARQTLMNTSSQQASAATLNEQSRRQAVARAKEQYSIETGQGPGACRSVALMDGAKQALGAAMPAALALYRDLDIGPGKATPLGKAARTRLDHAAEADAGVLLDPAASGDRRKRVIEQLAGLPVPLPAANAPGSEADLAMLRARRIEALRSPALVSLAALAAMANGPGQGGKPGGKDGAGKNAGGQPVLKELDALIARYGGGPEFTSWSAGLAGQSVRGLNVELNRLNAMALALEQAEGEQRERLSALQATLLAARAGNAP